MIKLTNAKINKRLNEFDDFKEYVIQKNIAVKKVMNQEIIGMIGEKIGEKSLSAKFDSISAKNNPNHNSEYREEKMLFYFF